MQIRAIEHAGRFVTPASGSTERISPTATSDGRASPADSLDDVVSTNGGEGDAPIRQDSAAAEHVPGVVRLLEEGHFHGVADVRLRINFYDALSARSAAALPDPAPPSGHGRAYAKFLAIYNSLRGGRTEPQPDAGPGGEVPNDAVDGDAAVIGPADEFAPASLLRPIDSGDSAGVTPQLDQVA